ncbi:hypothetical protein L5515_012505 [Caenorhabditis briggsae]|uniref:LIM zinc-binding domain-containing protein n=2 Tax=Caenorhabditis briggsae TaxID=6238 RepID=A0AAE9ESR9_CAEBR|nr:hypothetical protein L5515_012505 [Caenorhabditis briggsae]
MPRFKRAARAAAGRADEPAYLRSETLRLLKEQEHGAPTTLSNHPNPSGLPVCFMCTRPILGVMARAAGKNLHGDCLSCATCGNSLRNVGHHFIEDKFYCDIHGTQRKAGGRPGMDPNIFVKSSPTAAQPVHVQQESPRAAYHPQINQYARPVSVSPVPSAGGKTITTHYHTPKTQGILSPAQRGVPNAAFGADLSKTVTYGGGVGPGGTHYDPNRLSPAPSQFSQGSRQTAPPPVPSNPPPSHENPSSRVPDSVRSAVSPRRTGKVPRQWPPPQAPPTNRYWQIDPADALKKEKEKLNYGEDLAALIKEVEAAKGAEPKGAEPKKGAESKRKARRASNISKEQVKEAFEEHRKRKEAELRVDVKGEEHKGAEPKGAEPPKIESGIHWTVIHSPVRSPSPAKVTSEPSDGIFKPIPKYATPPPIQISKTATPVPFQAPPPSQAPPIPLPRSPELSPVRSYIVRSSDANITTSTELQTTVTRFSAAPPTNLAPPTARVHDQSTSPIPSIRLHRKNEKITVPTLSVEAATSSIKVKEATPTQAPPTVGFSENQAPPTFRNQAPAAFRSSDDQTPPTFKIDRPYEAPPTSHETTPPRSVQQREQAPPTRYEAPPTSHDVPKFEAQLTRSAQHKEQAPPLQAPPPKFEAPPTFQPREQTPPLLDHTALMDQVGRPSEYSYNPGSIKIHEPTGPRPLTVSPKPFLSSAHYHETHEAPPTSTATVRRDPKHFKKVDFSKTSPTVIPKTEWKDSADIIDESDILTEEIDDCSLLKAATYDGDESEMIDDVATFEIEEEEILEVSRPSKIRVVGKSQGGGEAEQLWRQRAMELLDDDAQTERDLMIVAALNERLQGLREMEDDDRVRAIECIARHQSELEQTQTQLSTLLESAIVYLQNLRPVEDTPEPSIAGDRVAELRKKVLDDLEQLPILGQAPPPPERKVFPFESYQPDREGAVETQSLHDVLDEFYSIRKPSGRSDSSAEDSRNFLAARLGQVMISDKNGVGDNGNGNLQGSSYTKTSFERTTTNGDAPQAGHLTTTTTTTQQQNGGRVPYCEACKNQIRGAFVLAAGKSWCPEHFVCANSSCRRRLLECGFVEEDGQKFCESCFEQHIAPKCSKCSKSIISDCLNALQKKWHPTCFTCAHCQKPFGNSAFYLEAGLPYCEQDWNALFTTKCVSCRYPIEAGDRWVEALGNAFHSNCFTCARCNINLEGESFFAKNGQPFCRNHA